MVKAFVDGGYEIGPRTDVAMVPEPGGWLLCFAGLTLLWHRCRRFGMRVTVPGNLALSARQQRRHERDASLRNAPACGRFQ